jgi:hypothetical protein
MDNTDQGFSFDEAPNPAPIAGKDAGFSFDEKQKAAPVEQPLTLQGGLGAAATGVAKGASNIAGTVKDVGSLPLAAAQLYTKATTTPEEYKDIERRYQKTFAPENQPSYLAGPFDYLPSSEDIKGAISPYLYQSKTPAEQRIESGTELGTTIAGGGEGGLLSKAKQFVTGLGVGYGAESAQQANPDNPFVKPVITIGGLLAGEGLGAAGKAMFGSDAAAQKAVSDALQTDIRNGTIDPTKFSATDNILDVAPPGSNIRKLVERQANKSSDYPPELTQFNVAAGSPQKLDQLRTGVKESFEQAARHPMDDAASLKSFVEKADQADVNKLYDLARSSPKAASIPRSIFGDVGNFQNVKDAEATVQNNIANDINADRYVIPKEASAGTEGGLIPTPQGLQQVPGKPPTPGQEGNLSYWDRVYRQLRDTGDTLSRVPETANAAQNNYNAAKQIRDALDQHVTEEGSSLYANARNRAQEAFGTSDSMATGEQAYTKFSRNPLENQQMDKDFASQTDAQKALGKYGFINAMHTDLNRPNGLPSIANKMASDTNFQNRAKMIMGEDDYHQVRGQILSANLKNSAKPLNIPANPPESPGFLQQVKNLGTAGAIGSAVVPAGIAVYNTLMDAAFANNLLSAGGLFGTGAAAMAVAGGKAVSDANVKATANKVLNLVAKSTPKDLATLSKMTETDPVASAFVTKLTGAMQSSQQPPQQASGGRIGRKSGGRATGAAKAKADQLIAMVDRIKKDEGEGTKPLLNVDDTTIAKALEIANRGI